MWNRRIRRAARGAAHSWSPACASSSTAATTRPAWRRVTRPSHRGAPLRRQARQPGRHAARAAARAARRASGTRAGRRTAARPSRTRTRTAPARWSSIHNGIIENYLELRAELERRGAHDGVGDRHRGHLAPDRRARAAKAAAWLEATRRAIARARGLVRDRRARPRPSPTGWSPRRARRPSCLGLGEGENFVASDIPALLEHTRTRRCSWRTARWPS